MECESGRGGKFASSILVFFDFLSSLEFPPVLVNFPVFSSDQALLTSFYFVQSSPFQSFCWKVFQCFAVLFQTNVLLGFHIEWCVAPGLSETNSPQKIYWQSLFSRGISSVAASHLIFGNYYWSRNDYTINSHDNLFVIIVRAISN